MTQWAICREAAADIEQGDHHATGAGDRRRFTTTLASKHVRNGSSAIIMHSEINRPNAVDKALAIKYPNGAKG